MSKSSSYLYHRPSGWYCCINVPADVRGIVNQSQLRHSLKTRFASLAKLRAAYIATRFKALVILLRTGAMKHLTNEHIKRIVGEWLQEALSMTEEARVLFGPYSNELLAEERGDLDKVESHYRNLLASRE